jgi:hypothetical protein
MWTLAFWGSSICVFQLLVFAGIFCIGVAVYNKWHFFGKELCGTKAFFCFEYYCGTFPGNILE